MARGMSALNTRMIGQIVSSWIVTLPAAGVLAALFYVGLQPIFP
jgi:phosphate/sulfate permease